MSAYYVPERGDIVWLSFDPQAGHEQAGHRPALVLSPALYNRAGLMLCCPLTTQVKGYAFEVLVDQKQGVVLADQVKSMDWKARNAKKKGCVTADTLEEVLAKLETLLS